MTGSRTLHVRRCSLALAAVLLLTAGGAHAQQAGLIQNAQARKTTSLDGLWRIIIDPLRERLLRLPLRAEPQRLLQERQAAGQERPRRIRLRQVGAAQRPRRLEHARPAPALLRGHRLVQEVFRLRAQAGHAPLRPLRRRQLRGRRLPQRREGRAARGRLHALRLRGHGAR